MLYEQTPPGDRGLDRPRDRSMLALQYAIAIVAAVAAALLAVLR